MTSLFKEYEVEIKTGTGLMTTAKIKSLSGYNLKFVIQWGQWTFGGGEGSLLGEFWLVG